MTVKLEQIEDIFNVQVYGNLKLIGNITSDQKIDISRFGITNIYQLIFIPETSTNLTAQFGFQNYISEHFYVTTSLNFSYVAKTLKLSNNQLEINLPRLNLTNVKGIRDWGGNITVYDYKNLTSRVIPGNLYYV